MINIFYNFNIGEKQNCFPPPFFLVDTGDGQTRSLVLFALSKGSVCSPKANTTTRVAIVGYEITKHNEPQEAATTQSNNAIQQRNPTTQTTKIPTQKSQKKKKKKKKNNENRL